MAKRKRPNHLDVVREHEHEPAETPGFTLIPWKAFALGDDERVIVIGWHNTCEAPVVARDVEGLTAGYGHCMTCDEHFNAVCTCGHQLTPEDDAIAYAKEIFAGGES